MELKKWKKIRIKISDEDFSKCSRFCEYQTDDIWGHHDFCMHYMDGTTSKRRLPECIQEFGIPEVKNGEIQQNINGKATDMSRGHTETVPGGNKTL